MATSPPRRRVPAGTSARQPRTSVKTSVSVDVELHARWSAAASLRGLDRNAFAVEAIRTACKGIVVVDRNRPKADLADSDTGEYRQTEAA